MKKIIKKIKSLDTEMFFVSFLLAMCILSGIAIGGMEEVKKQEQTEVKTETVESEPLLYGTVQYVSTVAVEGEWVGSGSDFHPVDCTLDVDVQEFIYYLSEGYDIDFHFIMAVIEKESSYQADCISKTNDYGLMQINKCNHEWLSEALGITDFLDPYENVMAGTYKFYTLFQEYGNDTHKVLMAYNMGSNSAKKLWNKGITSSKYSRAIVEIMERMKANGE